MFAIVRICWSFLFDWRFRCHFSSGVAASMVVTRTFSLRRMVLPKGRLKLRYSVARWKILSTSFSRIVIATRTDPLTPMAIMYVLMASDRARKQNWDAALCTVRVTVETKSKMLLICVFRAALTWLKSSSMTMLQSSSVSQTISVGSFFLLSNCEQTDIWLTSSVRNMALFLTPSKFWVSWETLSRLPPDKLIVLNAYSSSRHLLWILYRSGCRHWSDRVGRSLLCVLLVLRDCWQAEIQLNIRPKISFATPCVLFKFDSCPPSFMALMAVWSFFQIAFSISYFASRSDPKCAFCTSCEFSFAWKVL